jgi:hypothetical protein
MQAMPLLPRVLELAFTGERDEVHVTEVVRLASRERAEEDDA